MAREITDEYGNTIVIPDPIVNLQGDEAFKTTTFGGPGFEGEDTGDYDEYGWLQDFINIFRPYVEDQDVDDIDRIFRQEQAQEFQDLLERIYAGEATWRELNKEDYDFLNDIPEFSDYFDGVYDQAQYNGMLEDWQTVAKSDDLQAVEDFINEYGNAGIADNSLVQADLASKGSAVSVLTGTVDNAVWEQAIRDAAIGDGIFGAEIDFEDLPGYGGIWEGIVRHIKVIGRGLQLPIPDWLPLPGIFELPTIGEIFDTVTGPWKEASRQILNDCMAGDDGVVGPNPETGVNDDKLASTCLEDQSILDVLAQGAENAVGQVTDATIGKVTEITDKITSCAGIEKDEEGNVVGYDPELTKQCAQGVIDTIKDIFGEGAVDPTASGGIPDWIKGIIIGGTYGGDVIKEIEDIFGSDIDGDGDIGVGPELPPVTPVVECWDGSTAEKEEDCPPDTRVTCWDGSLAKTLEDCPVDTRTGETEEDCNLLGRVHVPDSSGGTKGSCGECKDSVNTVDEIEGDFSSPCVAPDDPTQQEGDPCNTGAPLNAEGTIGPAPDYDCIPVEGTTCTDPQTGQEGTIEDGQCKVAVTPVEQCEDPNRDKNEDGSCAPTCTDGSPAPASGLCPEPVTTCANGAENFPDCNQCPGGQSTPDMHEGNDCTKPLLDQGGGDDGGDDTGGGEELWDGECTSPRPNAAGSFLAQAEYRRWNEQCAATHCPSGVPKIDEFDDCSGEYTPTPTVNCDQQNRVTRDDGSCGECKPGWIDDPKGFDQCIQAPPECNDCSCAEYAEANPEECTTCPDGEAYCPETGKCETPENCPSTTPPPPEEEGGSLFGGGFGGGGANLFEPYSFAVTADPTLLGSKQFPITDFLAGVFTNSTGGKA